MTFAPKLRPDELDRFLDREFPQIHEGGRSFFVESVEPGVAHVRFSAGERHLRPGGTVSGPALFALADLAAYVVILAHAGPVALAVTTGATINFLRKPEPGDLTGEARILKFGKRLVVVDVGMRSASAPDLVAHAVLTYSMPDRSAAAPDG